jgi:hypothetical protein
MDDLTMLTAMIILFKSAMVRLYADVRDSAGKLLSVIFPNLELASHWPNQIRFLGPPWCQDTKLWEQCHLPARLTLTRTNQRFCERDILGKVSYSLLAPVSIILRDHAGPTPHLVHVQTHTDNAIIWHAVYARRPGALEFTDRDHTPEPYTFTGRSVALADITHNRRRLLSYAYGREFAPENDIGGRDEMSSAQLEHACLTWGYTYLIGEKDQATLRDITKHAGARYYTHILRPGNSVLVRVPDKHAQVALPFSVSSPFWCEVDMPSSPYPSPSLPMPPPPAPRSRSASSTAHTHASCHLRKNTGTWSWAPLHASS